MGGGYSHFILLQSRTAWKAKPPKWKPAIKPQGSEKVQAVEDHALSRHKVGGGSKGPGGRHTLWKAASKRWRTRPARFIPLPSKCGTRKL